MKRNRDVLSYEEHKAINTGSSDYSKCALLYAKHVLNNSGSFVTYSTGNVFAETELTDDDKKSKVYNIDDYKLKTYNLNDMKTLQTYYKKHKSSNKVSDVFESVYKSGGKHLNTNVIRPNAIVRIWNVIDKHSGVQTHSTATIDYDNRRVSFGTSNDKDTEIFIKGSKVGIGHLISSPEQSFVKKLLVFGRKSQKDMNNNLKLIAMGYLTEEHIKNLKDYLVNDTENFSVFENEFFIEHKPTEYRRSSRLSEHNFDIYPLISTQAYSKTIFYNQFRIYQAQQNTLTIKTEEKGKHKKAKNNMESINCAGLLSIIFKGIVCLDFMQFKKIPYFIDAVSPVSLVPSSAYNCADGNEIYEPSYTFRRDSQNIFCSFWKHSDYIALIAATLMSAGLGASNLIMPLDYGLNNYMSFQNIIGAGVLGQVYSIITSIKFYMKPRSAFGFGNILSKEQLQKSIGYENMVYLLKLNKTNRFAFSSITRKSRKRRKSTMKRGRSRKKSRKRKKSIKKSRKRRKSTMKSRKRKKSIKKSRKRRSTMKSRKRRSARKKSIKRRSTMKSRKRRSARKKSRKRRSTMKSRKRRSARKKSRKRRSTMKSRKRRKSRKKSRKRRSTMKSRKRRSARN
jgi:hypothetical protein